MPSFINAGLPYTTRSGAEMYPEVIEAMNYAATRRARISELHDAVGKKLSEMIGCEAGMISTGASAAITLGTAACITKGDSALICQLPDTKGLSNEVIIQKQHRYSYENSVRIAGAILVEVDGEEELIKAINKKTAMMLFYYGREAKGKIKAKDFIAIGKKYNVPVFLDGATTVPPASNLINVMKLNPDLACFSGGKGLHGPYSTGLLLGRKDLITAARLNACPHDRTIGRGMKVSKEELLGMLVAVEVSLSRNYQDDIITGKEWMKRIAEQLTGFKSLKPTIFVPENADQMPMLRLEWDTAEIKLTPAELKDNLKKGEPSIEVVSFGQSDGKFQVSSWMLKEQEVDIVAKRINEELKKAKN